MPRPYAQLGPPRCSTPAVRQRQQPWPAPPHALYYHQRFEERALKCSGQCSWKRQRSTFQRGPGPSPVGIVTNGNHPWIVTDPETGMQFFIDTGCNCSIIPFHRVPTYHPPVLSLQPTAAGLPLTIRYLYPYVWIRGVLLIENFCEPTPLMQLLD